MDSSQSRVGISTAALLLVLFSLCGDAVAADRIRPSAEVFGGLPAESDVALSPDGRSIAWIDHREAKPRVVMFGVDERKLRRILAVPEKTKLRDIIWHDNDTLLILLSETVETKDRTETSAEYWRTIAQDINGGDGRMLPMNHLDAEWHAGPLHPPLARLIAARTTKPHIAVISTYGECHDVFASCLAEVDTRTGIAKVTKVGNRFTTMWVVDREGQAVARADWDYRSHEYRVYALSGNAIREILRVHDADHPNVQGLLADGSALVLLASNGRPFQCAWALPLDGSPMRLLAEDPNADITRVYTDPYTGAIVGAYVSGSVTEVRWLDPVAQRRFDSIQRAFKKMRVEVYGWSVDGSRVVARVSSPSAAPIYYLVDFKTHHADIAAEEYPGLAGVTLGTVTEISYKSRDGVDIPAYLATPPDRSGTRMPLIVLPHGGPNARDDLEFEWLVQFLTTRGYAVLQPQFRGSSGYGDAFREAGYRQWGGRMQDDVTDGVKAMIDRGIADSQKVCIVGDSYGGYAALAGAAFTPDLYACAVSIAGISDIPALMHEEVPWLDGYISTSMSVWKQRIGDVGDASLVARSPINSVKTIRAPILLIYGTGDGVVPVDQSQAMGRALKSAGKVFELVTLPGEDHWLSRKETRTQVLEEIERFLAKYL